MGISCDVSQFQYEQVTLLLTMRCSILVVSLPLIFYPKLFLFLSESGEDHRTSLTPLESFLAWNTGLILVALSAALVVNVGCLDMYRQCPSNAESLRYRFL